MQRDQGPKKIRRTGEASGPINPGQSDVAETLDHADARRLPAQDRRPMQGHRDHRKGDAVRPLSIRIAKHEAAPDCGSFKVAFPDGRSSIYFYWNDNASRRLRPKILTQGEALEHAIQLACTQQDKLDATPLSGSGSYRRQYPRSRRL